MPELSGVASLVWGIAAIEAQRARAGQIGTDHLLVGLLSLEKLLEPATGLDLSGRELARLDHERIVRALARLGQDAAVLRRAVRARMQTGNAASPGTIHRDDACRAIFERAGALAQQLGDGQCGALHLLAALLESPPAALEAALPATTGGPAVARLRRAVLAEMSPVPGARTPQPALPGGPAAPVPTPPGTPTGAAQSGLARSGPAAPLAMLRYGRDLTAEAEAGKLGPVIGRRDEMLQVVRVLHRRTKSSPVLIGEAGVGKTAVVEGLAQRIAEGTVLPGRRIVALSLASVVAGTTYRGQFEERLEEILTELRGRPEIILFLDELHTIVGAGDRDGRLDAANILKPALSRGEIACIGATTTDEYRRHIESDPALERRFQPIMVAEPTPAEARTILDGLRADLERHHGVRIESEALDAAVELTVRYVTARRLPDKAVDALDEACARASVPALTLVTEVADLTDGAGMVVTRDTVGAVVSAWTGIPVGRIGQAEADRLADLETRLAAQVVGQPEAVRRVAQRVRLARMNMTDPERPAGVFLFLGPSGVGKTELARALSDIALDGPQRLIRLDMSEYGEQHAAARLIGAPPGYLGHGDEGQLTGPLRRSPHAIVLLDEAEKAHPEVFDLFLQLFDAGRLTDGSGRLVDGRQAIFVLTSNLTVRGHGRPAIGFGALGGSGRGTQEPGPDREALLADVRQFFRPELLHRIDEIVLFRSLGEADLREIADRQLRALRLRLLEQHEVDLAITPLALAFLARQAAAGSGGAREVQRLITQLIETPLSRELLAGTYLRGEQLIADLLGERLVLARDTRSR